MSFVIIGGNERMAGRYEDICRHYGHTAKVFVKESGAIKKKLGCPDMLILFTNTVSHKMVVSAAQEARRNHIPIARAHSSSVSALQALLEEMKQDTNLPDQKGESRP
ncbi:MAG: DUF2325 domain-containing protein [Massiliimalia sp.]|jgi:hypothetical protein